MCFSLTLCPPAEAFRNGRTAGERPECLVVKIDIREKEARKSSAAKQHTTRGINTELKKGRGNNTAPEESANECNAVIGVWAAAGRRMRGGCDEGMTRLEGAAAMTLTS